VRRLELVAELGRGLDGRAGQAECQQGRPGAGGGAGEGWRSGAGGGARRLGGARRGRKQDFMTDILPHFRRLQPAHLSLAAGGDRSLMGGMGPMTLMRRKLAIVAVAAALAVSLGFLVFGPSFVPDPAAAGDGLRPSRRVMRAWRPPPKRPSHPRPVEPAAEGASDPGAAERQEAYVAARCAELGDLGMRNDADSLNSILAELGNRDPRIRQRRWRRRCSSTAWKPFPARGGGVADRERQGAGGDRGGDRVSEAADADRGDAAGTAAGAGTEVTRWGQNRVLITAIP